MSSNMLILSLYVCCALQGATQDGERKFQINSNSNVALFWKQACQYGDAYQQRDKQIAALRKMGELITGNLEILSMHGLNVNIRIDERRISQVKRCCPFEFAVRITCERENTEPEWVFFQKVVDRGNNDQRISVLNFGVRHCYFDVVQKLLKSGTDITRAPQVMTRLFCYSTSLNDRHLKICHELTVLHEKYREAPDGIIEPILVEKELDLLRRLNRYTNRQQCLLAIMNLLLLRNADLSEVAQLINKTPVEHPDCLIYKCLEDQIALSLRIDLGGTVSPRLLRAKRHDQRISTVDELCRYTNENIPRTLCESSSSSSSSSLPSSSLSSSASSSSSAVSSSLPSILTEASRQLIFECP